MAPAGDGFGSGADVGQQAEVPVARSAPLEPKPAVPTEQGRRAHSAAPTSAASTAEGGAHTPEAGRASGKLLVEVGARFGLVFGLILVIIVFSFVTKQFLTVGNFTNLGTSEAMTLVLAVAATIVLKAGDFDLSLSATMIIGAIALDLLMVNQHLPLVLAMIITLAICAGIGLVNGFLVVVLGLDSFVTTLATQTVLTGVGYGLTNNQVLFTVPSNVLSGMRGSFITSSLPIACLYGWLIAIAVGWILGRTPLGRRIAIIGASRETAALLGIRGSRIRLACYASASLLAGFAGFVLLGLIGSVDPSSGTEYILTPFAAAFLGTTVGKAGRFNILGTILALYFLSLTEQGLILAGAPSWIADVFNGLALAAALAFAKLWRDSRKRTVVGATL